MATLTRARLGTSSDTVDTATAAEHVERALAPLEEGVPTPFPRAEHERLRQENQAQSTPATTAAQRQDEVLIELDNDEAEREAESGIIIGDLQPSIGAVQQSCITTLTDLLSSPAPWAPVRSDRRHSMPPQSPVLRDVSDGRNHDASAALQGLITNLRNREHDLMVETRVSPRICEGGETHLLNELRMRVDTLAPTLEPADALLAQSIVTLLAYFHRLVFLQSQSRPQSSVPTPLGDGLTASSSRPSQLARSYSSSPFINSVDHPIDNLKRQLSDLQTERLSSQSFLPNAPPVIAVETALLWSRIDNELESMLALCRERTEGLPRFSASDDDYHPPEYTTSHDYSHSSDIDKPPEYEHGERSKMSYHRADTSQASNSSLQDEKMRQDLDAVTRAIDRLYAVAPQLHNQRVELKSDKLRELELARTAPELLAIQGDVLGASSSPALSRVSRGKQREQTSKGKGKNKIKDIGLAADAKNIEELERMLDLIGRASSRSLTNQTVVLAQGVSTPLERAKAKDSAQRDALLTHLIEHSLSGRLSEQEAEMHPHQTPRLDQAQFEYNIFGDPVTDKERDPDALLTLPEFIREIPPPSSMHALQEREREVHMQAMLTLPEFIREPPPPRAVPNAITSPGTPSSLHRWHRKSRNRSLSAPSLSWLRPSLSSSKSGTKQEAETENSSLSTSTLHVSYLAENHETLQHILVFLNVEGATPGVEVAAEVLPSFNERPRSDDREQTPEPDDSAISGSPPTLKIPTSPARRPSKLRGSPRWKPSSLPRGAKSPSKSLVQAHSDRLVIKCGVQTSLPLSLPGRTAPGKKSIQVQSGHFEIKLSTAIPQTEATADGLIASDQASSLAAAESLPLLDATQLTAAAPTSFICASCSLPLVHTGLAPSSSDPASFQAGFGGTPQEDAGRYTYRDLPSEHWQELVDAWMCHSDQGLHERIVKHAGGWASPDDSRESRDVKSSGGGFWPGPGEALVGGSYILFGEDAIVKGNVCPPEVHQRGDDWRLVRCLCGAVIGRCQTQRRHYHHFARQMQQNGNSTEVSPNGQTPLVADSNPFADLGTEEIPAVYRLLKFAIRPVSHTADPVKIPLSAFIVEDMTEFVNAHATYRFIVFDEEDEKPRILIWLFKPSIRISYSKVAAYAIPKSASINAAKVLFKLLGPAESSGDLQEIVNKVPGFPQAEYLYYPMNICRRLAGLLAESKQCYPESMRTMTGLDVGFLRRA